MLPVVVYTLITAAVCVAGGSFTCFMFWLGIKHGIEDACKGMGVSESDTGEE